MSNKGDFIIDLLTSKRLTDKDRERILKLSAREFEKSDLEYQNILQRIDSLQKEYLENQKNLSQKIDDFIDILTHFCFNMFSVCV